MLGLGTNLWCAGEARSKQHKLVLTHGGQVRHEGHRSFSGNRPVISLVRGFQHHVPGQRPYRLPALAAVSTQQAIHPVSNILQY